MSSRLTKDTKAKIIESCLNKSKVVTKVVKEVKRLDDLIITILRNLPLNSNSIKLNTTVKLFNKDNNQNISALSDYPVVSFGETTRKNDVISNKCRLNLSKYFYLFKSVTSFNNYTSDRKSQLSYTFENFIISMPVDKSTEKGILLPEVTLLDKDTADAIISLLIKRRRLIYDNAEEFDKISDLVTNTVNSCNTSAQLHKNAPELAKLVPSVLLDPPTAPNKQVAILTSEVKTYFNTP